VEATLTSRIRIYEIYPGPTGLSAQTEDYHGAFYIVAAVSIRQAYWLASHMRWAGGPDNLTGVIEFYQRGGAPEGWHTLWDGCRIHHGTGIRHGATITATRRAMQSHIDSHAA